MKILILRGVLEDEDHDPSVPDPSRVLGAVVQCHDETLSDFKVRYDATVAKLRATGLWKALFADHCEEL